jgi:CHAD domain-containing protein
MQSAVADYVSQQCLVIIESGPALLAHDDVVHPTRVAARRLRSTLHSFAEVFEESKAAALETELAWWAAQLGAVRDLDVLQTRLTSALDELAPELVMGPVASHLQAEIAARRKVAYDALLEALAGERYAGLVELLTRWRTAAPFTDPTDRPVAAIKAIVKKTGKTQRKRLAAAEPAEGAESDDLLHRARKAAKRHRYALELAAPVLGKKTAKQIESARSIQDALGAHQDSLVSAALLREVGAAVGSTPGHNGFTYGLLYAQEVEFQRAFTKRFTDLLA